MSAARMRLVSSTSAPRSGVECGSALLNAACTCGRAPRAECLACARWFRKFKEIAARRAAASGRGGAL